MLENSRFAGVFACSQMIYAICFGYGQSDTPPREHYSTRRCLIFAEAANASSQHPRSAGRIVDRKPRGRSDRRDARRRSCNGRHPRERQHRSRPPALVSRTRPPRERGNAASWTVRSSGTTFVECASVRRPASATGKARNTRERRRESSRFGKASTIEDADADGLSGAGASESRDCARGGRSRPSRKRPSGKRSARHRAAAVGRPEPARLCGSTPPARVQRPRRGRSS
jgi:hypothetical protein